MRERQKHGKIDGLKVGRKKEIQYTIPESTRAVELDCYRIIALRFFRLFEISKDSDLDKQ